MPPNWVVSVAVLGGKSNEGRQAPARYCVLPRRWNVQSQWGQPLALGRGAAAIFVTYISCVVLKVVAAQLSPLS